MDVHDIHALECRGHFLPRHSLVWDGWFNLMLKLHILSSIFQCLGLQSSRVSAFRPASLLVAGEASIMILWKLPWSLLGHELESPTLPSISGVLVQITHFCTSTKKQTLNLNINIAYLRNLKSSVLILIGVIF